MTTEDSNKQMNGVRKSMQNLDEKVSKETEILKKKLIRK
jgi:hypothetical protein